MNAAIYVFATLIVCVIATFVLCHLHVAFVVNEGFAGLLYQHGKFLAVLPVGRHIRWGRGFTLELLDTRLAILAVSGQDVLTADNVNLKVSVAVNYQIVDPVKATQATQSWYNDLYNAIQLAARAAVNSATIETLLASRADLGGPLLARLQPDAAKVGLAVHAAEVKDVMLPAELKRAFADTLKAKQEGQAALERARGESAALRNLANAARLLDGNPALQNLRLLQSLQHVQGAGHTLVLGMPAGFVPLKNGHAAPPAEPPAGDD